MLSCPLEYLLVTELLDGIDQMELRGRRQKRLSAVVVRPLQEADIAVLASGARQPTQSPRIARLRDRHHTVARLIANGATNGHVSLVTGMDPARISVLRGDPSFKELVADYRSIDDGLQADFQERAATLSLTAMEELQDRIENAEEPVPLQTLLEVAKFGADRTGNGPQSKQTHVNVNVELSARLSSARKRLLPGPASVTEAATDAEFTSVDIVASTPSADIVDPTPEDGT